MEDQISQSEVAQQGPPQAVSFNQPKKDSNGGTKWLIIFIGLLILGGAGIFFFTKTANAPIPTPTPTYRVIPVESIEPISATPTPAAIKRSEISIEIQNGTGITGEAKLLQTKLELLGYSDITVGNASSTDNTTTTVTFTKTVSQSVQDEIKKELEKTYKIVTVKSVTTQKTDILVLTGTRISSSTQTATSTASPSATPKN